MIGKKHLINDCILIAFFIIATGVVSYFIFGGDNDTSNDDNLLRVVVTIDGEIDSSYELRKGSDSNREIMLKTGNLLVIEEGQVYLKDANCPDKLCVKQGRINEEGEAIICLPHKLVIKIERYNDNIETTSDELDVMP